MQCRAVHPHGQTGVISRARVGQAAGALDAGGLQLRGQ